MPRKPWDIAFTADRTEVAALRRIMRSHLSTWGLHEVIDEAQLCVSELVTNVITHVGAGTPATLAVSMRGVRLRIEVHDPDTHALPVLSDSALDAEKGRGMALVAAVADCWGVQMRLDRKVTWCELATRLTSPHGHLDDPRVTRAESVLGLYTWPWSHHPSDPVRLGATVTREAVIEAVTDLLHWLHAHGWDGDEALDLAQTRFEGQVASRDVRAGPE
ncbi:anti-sigma regulatory factor (Ser/Thr protein kinase) [Streptomyces sp. SAI-170]|uniref:ATP-binding protein n=1 Tax=Streptomyces sp. SAI-170 TaxID=3377729 RepID=UPI003C7E0AB2